MFQAKGRASAKALRQERAWGVVRMATWPMLLESGWPMGLSSILGSFLAQWGHCKGFEQMINIILFPSLDLILVTMGRMAKEVQTIIVLQ